MPINMNQAISAYNNAAKTFGQGGDSAKKAEGGGHPGDDFGSMVKQSLRDAIDVQKTGERLSVAAIAGKADINEVITAVAEADVTLQAVVSIRDKVIEAYKEISRMPI
ncbi:MAG: flagellar hook-basal body complex protein FliE [Rhodospirillales bacterium]|nr:flagellar hook-basal body complex protein FliE [Rhodospirillales bacterium]MCW8861055.1 flagellar hook-basal body complex protein FliE [Rhodospirillales bacterium]MCW8953057.1 flagellar hook-basal body complex protein FliE [Rhodospirillales bacterium]MCW8970695.1 flagellar hook-basal body complex protein FliE [Rhodospirillales bacterium]MCW9003478.1 flagellar hook-basal body complex protein FliE [Rhodospirillales bacterium]